MTDSSGSPFQDFFFKVCKTRCSHGQEHILSECLSRSDTDHQMVRMITREGMKVSAGCLWRLRSHAAHSKLLHTPTDAVFLVMIEILIKTCCKWMLKAHNHWPHYSSVEDCFSSCRFWICIQSKRHLKGSFRTKMHFSLEVNVTAVPFAEQKPKLFIWIISDGSVTRVGLIRSW